MSIYLMQSPTEWAGPPNLWSSTTLDDADTCPRRWQLLHSRWGELDRFPRRESPSVIEGLIVHEALDRLTRACGIAGNPAIGTEEFVRALESADFFAGFKAALAEWQARLDAHPRPGPPFRLRARPDDLANRAIRMFRDQYRCGGSASLQETRPQTEEIGSVQALLEHRRALSEIRLRHPGIPFVGILDRVTLTEEGEVEIVDFKTGRPDLSHHRQLLRYAVLWWRTTGEVPVRVSAQYLGGTANHPVSIEALKATEADIATLCSSLSTAMSEAPAAARPGPQCARCPVRAKCSRGWALAEAAALSGGRGDIELMVMTKPTPHGFIGQHPRHEADIAVVYASALEESIPRLDVGMRIRLVDAVWGKNREQLEVKAWTEVYTVADP